MTIFDRTEKSESGKASVASTIFQRKPSSFTSNLALSPLEVRKDSTLSGYIKNNNNIVMWGIM